MEKEFNKNTNQVRQKFTLPESSSNKDKFVNDIGNGSSDTIDYSLQICREYDPNNDGVLLGYLINKKHNSNFVIKSINVIKLKGYSIYSLKDYLSSEFGISISIGDNYINNHNGKGRNYNDDDLNLNLKYDWIKEFYTDGLGTDESKSFSISYYKTIEVGKDEFSYDIVNLILYNFTINEFESVKEYINSIIVIPEKKKRVGSNINLILSSSSGYNFMNYDIVTPVINLDTYYDKGFRDNVHNPLVESLSDNKSGLYFLHGHKGTGKTTYIRYLTSIINKQYFIISKEFVRILTEPGFLLFLIQKCSNSIIIVEDAEEIIRPSEENYANNSTSTILNMSDGILSDIVNCKFILTFNTEINKIDSALTRAGRLKFNHEFQKLSIEYANIVSKELGIGAEFDEATALCDIFNYNIINNAESIKKEKSVVGFKR